MAATKTPPSMVPVEIVDDGSTHAPTGAESRMSVISPSGWRIEGLDVASPVTLLRALS